MNERFLFRGKRKDNGKWVYGWLRSLHSYDPQTKQISSIYFTEISDDLRSRADIIVDYKTVGQCTGLEDKNGKLIFEGDIIKTKEYGRDIGHSNVNNFDIFKVIYEPAVFRLENVRRGFNLVGNGNDFEIIGNIHDNPELLEVER